MIETRCSRRPGRIEFQDRKLPRFSHRRFRTGTGDARDHPGAEVRRQHDDRRTASTRLDCDRRPYQVLLDDGEPLPARSIVISTGAQYNKPRLANLAQFEGRGHLLRRHFPSNRSCARAEEVVVVGGGNSAGQAAVFLSQTARKVHMLVRSGALGHHVSLPDPADRLRIPRIELHLHTEIVALEGDTHLEQVTWRNNDTGDTETHPIRHVFIMAGASPRTEWLRGCLALDDKGFIITGRDLDTFEGPPLAALPPSADAGDEPARSLCRGRCALRQCQSGSPPPWARAPSPSTWCTASWPISVDACYPQGK